MLQQILEILKYVLPAVVVLITAYVIIQKFLVTEIQRKQLAIFQENAAASLQMRMQAYERLAIFVERMHPNSMISRFYTKDSTAQDLQLAMVQSIRAEFEHNLSQQIYVSNEVWKTINAVKEQEITMINRIGSTIPMGAPAAEFVKNISDFVLSDAQELPTSIALEMINKEAKFLLFEGK